MNWTLFICGLIAFALWARLFWVIFMHEPVWLKTWNWRSGTLLIVTPILFFTSLACMLRLKDHETPSPLRCR